jgi:hypothetical protein
MAFTVKKFANHETLATFLTGNPEIIIDAVFWAHGIVLVYHSS